jgi:hypothetical protein
VERQLGRAAIVSAAQADLAIEGRVEKTAQGFRANVTLTNAHGETLGTRELESANSDCRALDGSLALVIALLIDPDAALGPRPPPPPAPAPVVVKERIFVPVPAQAAPPRPWGVNISLGPSFAAGLLPRIGVGVGLRAQLDPPAFVPIEVGVNLWLDAHVDAPGTPTRGATLSLSYGYLGACPLAYLRGRARVAACADLVGGALQAGGHGFRTSNAVGQESPLVAAMLVGRTGIRLVGALELGVGLGMVIPFTRPAIEYLDTGSTQQELFRVSAVTAVADATLSLAFP